MQAGTILFLSLEDVIKCGATDIKMCTERVKLGFKLFSENKIILPSKITLKTSKTGSETETGLINFLTSCINLNGKELYTCKAIGAMPINTQNGLPRASGLISLFDDKTKTPLCVMDAQVISAMRTGAVSSLAAEKLIDKSVNSAGLIGAGVNMRTQLLGLKNALPNLNNIDVYSNDNTKFIFADEMSKKLDIAINPKNTIEEAVINKDLLVSCVANITKPIIKKAWLNNTGLTLFNIGCYEFETSVLKTMDRVIADLWQQGKHRGVQTHAMAVKEGVIHEAKIEDLSPILEGQKPGRTYKDENIFFCPTGTGFSDAMVAWEIYRRALELKVGIELTLWKNHKWI